MSLRKLQIVILIPVFLMLVSCVTTERGGIKKANKKEAIERSVALSRKYIQQGNWDAAKRHLKIALDYDKSSAEGHEAMAMVLQNTGEFERAQEHYEKAIKLNGGLSRIRNNYSAFLYQQKQYRKAIKQLSVVVDDTLYVRRGAAFINLGRCYVQVKEFQNAEEAFHRAYLMDRNNIVLSFELAEVYFSLEKYAESLKFYDGYRFRVKQQPARALWLGIQLADQLNNKDALSSYALALKNLYPKSREYLTYKNRYGNDG